MTVDEFKTQLAGDNIILTDQQLAQFDRYAKLLITWNEVMNLTAITAIDDIYEKHFYDSLLPFIKYQPSGILCDVGSGAGFPGVVLKIVYPKLKIVLLEPIKKRVRFLQELIGELKLIDISVINERGEDHALVKREYYDWVTARAVANLTILGELCIPLIKVKGYFMALKGSSGESEYTSSLKAIKLLGCELKDKDIKELMDGSVRYNVLFTKIKRTPMIYPRSFAQIKKRPL